VLDVSGAEALGPAGRRGLGVGGHHAHDAQRHAHGRALSFPLGGQAGQADDDDRRGAARLVLPARREARLPHAGGRPRRLRRRGCGRAGAHRAHAQAARHRPRQYEDQRDAGYRPIHVDRHRYGTRGDALSHRARGPRRRHRRLGLGCAVRAHGQALRRDARSVDHLGRPLRRHRRPLLPDGEAHQSGEAAGDRIHRRVLPDQDQSGVRRLGPRRRHAD